jgi:very-short-patch-repair endonuclease
MVNENELKLFIDGQVTTKDGREFTRLVGGFGEENPVISAKQLGELLGYSNGVKSVNLIMNRNQEHFKEGMDYIDLKSEVPQSDTLTNTFNILTEIGYTQNGLNRSKNIYIFSLEGFLLFLSIIEVNNDYTSFIQDYFQVDKTMTTTIIPMRYELAFGKMLQTIFKNVLTFETQYSCCNNKYRIDFYEPTLKLAIEYDEEHHDYQQYEDNQRESEIHNELGCNFIRVKKGQELKGINEIFKYIYNKNNKMEVIA